MTTPKCVAVLAFLLIGISTVQKIFKRENCVMCHTPPLYTNNKLTPVDGFTVPEDHLNMYDILPISVGTDPNLTLKTRRGTGYYKVSSLKGVWYRSMFGHNGWCFPNNLRAYPRLQDLGSGQT